MVLRTNLATRPFYNVRVVQAALGAFGLLVLAFTAFNVVELMRLSASQAQLGSHAQDAEREAQRLRAEAARIRTQIDTKELDAVSRAAREANGIIDRRAFSWTELLTRFEATLPDDVRITTVQPRLDDKNNFVVGVIAEGRRVEDLDAFVEALEKTGGFQNVLTTEERTGEDGLLHAVIEGTYIPPQREVPKQTSVPPQREAPKETSVPPQREAPKETSRD
jgi:hypothetical protein